MNVGKNMRRLAALGMLSAAGFAVVPSQARAEDGPIVDISLPVTLCGIQVGVLGNASGDCPNTPQQAPAIDINLDPVLSGEILAPVTGLLENPEILLNPEALPTLLDPNTIGGVVNGGNPVINLDAPVLVCGNAVAVLTDASGTCPDAPPAGPEGQDSTINGNVQVTVCGNGIGVLTPGAGDCGGTAGSPGNDVGLPLGLSDAIPVNSIVDTLGSSIGPGQVLDVRQIFRDSGLGELIDLNVQADICGNGAAVAEDASAACPQSTPGTTTPGTTTPGTTTPGTTAPGTTTPGGGGTPTTTPGGGTSAPGASDTTTPAGGGNGGGGNGGGGNGGGGGGLLPTTGGTVLPLLGLGSLLAAAGIIARRASRTRRSLAA